MSRSLRRCTNTVPRRKEENAINAEGRNNAGRVAAAAANIAKGALSGGPYGAAAAAVAEAAPSLLKGAGIALLICLGLPLLMLLSIPCNLFGSPSASSADIQEMTSQAEQLTVTWKDQRSLEDKAINLFVDLLPENLGFISIEKNLGNTNDYWMVAITSVYSEQDVMLIDEDKIVQTMQAKTVHPR